MMARRQSNDRVKIMGLARGPLLALLATMLVIELLLAPIAWANPTGLEKGHANYNLNNNLDELISELVDDANQRLKKSKVGRPLKSSLRFGRSDPLFGPHEVDEAQDNKPMYQNPFSLD